MKKRYIVLALCVSLLCGTAVAFNILPLSSSDRQLSSGTEYIEQIYDELFWFDSSAHMVSKVPFSFSGGWVGTLEGLDEVSRDFPNNAIIIGEAIGPSINRIMRPAYHLRGHNAVSGQNHVITPILVRYIVYVGDEITNIRVGEIVDVMESHYFVTPETQDYVHGWPLNTVKNRRWGQPMEMGNAYLMYLVYHSTAIAHRYNGEVILHAFYDEQVHPLSPIAPITATPNLPQHIIDWHQSALSMYGHLYHLPPPPPAPMPTPSTPTSITLITQGANDITIHDSNNNPIIRDGRSLYRETADGTLQRIGTRTPISHAMRRFHYELYPDQYTFTNMQFHPQIPASIMIGNFVDGEKAAMASYSSLSHARPLSLTLSLSNLRLQDSVQGSTIFPSESWGWDIIPISTNYREGEVVPNNQLLTESQWQRLPGRVIERTVSTPEFEIRNNVLTFGQDGTVTVHALFSGGDGNDVGYTFVIAGKAGDRVDLRFQLVNSNRRTVTANWEAYKIGGFEAAR